MTNFHTECFLLFIQSSTCRSIFSHISLLLPPRKHSRFQQRSLRQFTFSSSRLSTVLCASKQVITETTLKSPKLALGNKTYHFELNAPVANAISAAGSRAPLAIVERRSWCSGARRSCLMASRSSAPAAAGRVRRRFAFPGGRYYVAAKGRRQGAAWRSSQDAAAVATRWRWRTVERGSRGSGARCRQSRGTQL